MSTLELSRSSYKFFESSFECGEFRETFVGDVSVKGRAVRATLVASYPWYEIDDSTLTKRGVARVVAVNGSSTCIVLIDPDGELSLMKGKEFADATSVAVARLEAHVLRHDRSANLALVRLHTGLFAIAHMNHIDIELLTAIEPRPELPRRTVYAGAKRLVVIEAFAKNAAASRRKRKP